MGVIREGLPGYVLDGDNVRHRLRKDLGLSAAHRAENIRRIAETAKLFTDVVTIVTTSIISPYRVERDFAGRIHMAFGHNFAGIYIDTPLEVCEGRDPKGIYAKARRGELKGFTGNFAAGSHFAKTPDAIDESISGLKALKPAPSDVSRVEPALGRLYASKGGPAKAGAYFQRAVKANPDFAPACVALGDPAVSPPVAQRTVPVWRGRSLGPKKPRLAVHRREAPG